MLGTTPAEILINDVKVHTGKRERFTFSVSRGRGPTAAPVVVCVDHAGKLSELKLENASFGKGGIEQHRGFGEPAESINHRGWHNFGRESESSRVLSNEEIRIEGCGWLIIPFKGRIGARAWRYSMEATTRFETRSPVRTFF